MASYHNVTSPRWPNLLDRVREAVRVRHLSYRTEHAYVAWVKRFVLFHGKRHPRNMGKAEVEAFLTHLAVDGRVLAPTENQALAAITTSERSRNALATRMSGRR